VSFDEHVDAAASRDDAVDAQMLPACTTAWFDIPTLTANTSYFVVRAAAGWAVVDIASATNELELRLISDDNVIGPRIVLTPTPPGSIMDGLAFVGGALHVVWGDNNDHVFGRFGLDGSSLGTTSLGLTNIGRVSGDNAQTALTTFNAGVAAEQAFDASGASISGSHTVSATATLPGALAHGANGYGVLWLNGTGPFQLHLTGLDEAGAIVLADRMLDTTSNRPDIVWTGTRYVISWAQSGTGMPFVATVDGAFSPLSGPLTPLGITDITIPMIAWNGDELGFVRFATSPDPADQRFSPMDIAGVATGPDVLLGDALGGQTTGAQIAGGPRRFAIVWTTGTQYQLRFGVVCR
jgi:hypothetical protein